MYISINILLKLIVCYRVNVSKEMMGFIEFPFTADYPTWPRHDQIHQYLQHYTEHFDLLKYIKVSASLLLYYKRVL